MTACVKWAAGVVVAVVALLAVVVWVQLATTRAPYLMNTKHIELTGWSSYWDGGSRSFSFKLSQGRSMVVFVPHRNPALGGNPDFQEVWLGPNDRAKHEVRLEPGSTLEARFLTLLRTATVKTNPEASSTNWPGVPTPKDLNWLAERIQDRQSKW